MPGRSRLDDDAIQAALAALPRWQLRDGKLHRELQFDDFVSAFGFLSRVALVAERMDHHPDWSNAYGRVVIDLHTHDLGGVSSRDLALAEAIESLL